MSEVAYLVLDDGRIFKGEAWGARGETFGEAVFATGMTGYQETLTDPSYHKQVVVMTAPHIGNTGINNEDQESSRFWVSGFAVRDPSPVVSNWRADGSLEEEMRRQGIVGIKSLDTRAITRHLRDRGAMRAGIFSAGSKNREEMVIAVRQSPKMSGLMLADEVTTPSKYVVPAKGEKLFTVVALDLGVKAATPRNMSERGIEVHVFPSSLKNEDLLKEIETISPDGFFLSNGPGDPETMNETVALVREILNREIPVFGICFGHQILGRALGFETYKLKFGHRGVNQPVLNRRSGRIEITAHNHGFALEAPTEGHFSTVYGPGEVTHICLNDGVIEGFRLIERPAFSVQYHPEAAAGPHDANYLFDDFVELMKGAKRG
ncbi:MAG: glutamine-hydrolyzing carbamoyl-phosphate synthase small subunit [Actinomycetota bacterium]